MPRFRADLKRFVRRCCELLPQRLDLLLGVLKLPSVRLRRTLGRGRLVGLPSFRKRDLLRDDRSDVSRDRVRRLLLHLRGLLFHRSRFVFLFEFFFPTIILVAIGRRRAGGYTTSIVLFVFVKVVFRSDNLIEARRVEDVLAVFLRSFDEPRRFHDELIIDVGCTETVLVHDRHRLTGELASVVVVRKQRHDRVDIVLRSRQARCVSLFCDVTDNECGSVPFDRKAFIFTPNVYLRSQVFSAEGC